MAPPTVVLADLHLSRGTPSAVGRDLVRLLERHRGARVIFAGDLFDLATGLPDLSRERAVVEVLEARPEIRVGLARHLDGGGELWLAPGNHDPDLGGDELRRTLLDTCGAGASARPRCRGTRWFFRLGSLHVEHGHVYDPDNAPEHPLVVGSPSLGTHFSVEFMHPTRAFEYLLTNESTPGKLFLSAFKQYGRRGPYVVFRYFYAAFLALLRSGPRYDGAHEQEHGQSLQEVFAAEAGVSPQLVNQLCGLTARPTLTSLRATFARLYLDRALATVALATGVAASAASRRRAGPILAAAGAAALVASWLGGHDRYRDNVSYRLARAAEEIAETTGANLVVFGHTHREDVGQGYANTGSFAHPRPPCSPGRPYLEIEEAGGRPRAVRRRIT